MKVISNLIYFDNNATTQLDERVADAMNIVGSKDASHLDTELRISISKLIQCKPQELFFTNGITPAIHSALEIVYNSCKHKGKHIITSSIEHKEVLQALDTLKSNGADVTYLQVNREGLVDPLELKAAIRPDTAFVSIMTANNHTGVIQSMEQMSEICHNHDLLFFSDASQFVGKMRTDVTELGIDCLVFGSNKMHGPDAIGVIYVKENTVLFEVMKKDYLIEIIDPALIMGFAKASEICGDDHWENSSHISKIKNYFEHQLLDIEGLRINGSTRHRLYNTSNLTFPPNKNIISLANRFKFLNYTNDNSYALKAMGLNEEDIRHTFRFSFGKYNTLEEVQLLVSEIMNL